MKKILIIENRNTLRYENYYLAVEACGAEAVEPQMYGAADIVGSVDGVIEAFSHTKLPIYCVQWHPERMCLKNARTDTVDGLKIFEYFVNRC